MIIWNKFKPNHQDPSAHPRDYTKAFDTIPSSGTYAIPMYPTSGKGERADMVKATGNHFYINTDFFFVIPIQDIKDLLKVNQVERIYFELTVEVPKGNITVFGKSFSVTKEGKRVINLAIQQSRVDEIASQPELKNLEFMDKVEKITVAAGSAYVQSNRSAFIGPDSDRKVKYWSQPAGKFFALNESTLELLEKVRGKDYEMLYYTQHGNYQIVNGDRFMMDVYGNGYQSRLYGYYYYEVRTSMKQNSSFVSDSGSMTTYIPALWGLPEEGKATYLRMVEPACIDRNECKFSNIDKLNNTCPTQTLECCSLCTDSKTRDIYRNTLFCKSISKCGTCQTTPRCTLDETKVDLNALLVAVVM